MRNVRVFKGKYIHFLGRKTIVPSSTTAINSVPSFQPTAAICLGGIVTTYFGILCHLLFLIVAFEASQLGAYSITESFRHIGFRYRINILGT